MPNNTREDKLKAFERLLDVMDTLREKCPWDRKQTNESLRENTIEETPFSSCAKPGPNVMRTAFTSLMA